MSGMDLKLMRIKAGLCQWDIARICNVSQAQVSLWEKDHRVIDDESKRKVKEACEVK